ncbi:unnamed protein product [Ilex paraguariensis]|uniref:Exocyst subunit Exo70 family protein n=1 Tax=Ilex paraguariensis TaxID=185542 RepID=A0ABC8RSK3_9AQUA
MGDCESMIPVNDGEQHVFAAAQHIVKALAASRNLNNDMRKLLVDLDLHLSTMTKISESEALSTLELEETLKNAEKKIMKWHSNQSMIWDLGPQEASEYLQVVDEVRKLTESLESLLVNRNEKQKELFNKAHSVLQVAMARLEGELIDILARNRQSFDPEHLSFRSCEETAVDEKSIVSTGDDSVEDTPRRENSTTESEECMVDLVCSHAIIDIKSIANVMFASRFGQEFCQAFISFWKNALDDYLMMLDVDMLSIEDVLKMEWESLYSRINKWLRAMKNTIRFYLANEKRLFDQVLGEYGSASLTCFVETSKSSILCLLNFGEAIVVRTYQPESLSCLLDIYDVLADLLQDIDALFSDEAGSCIRNEFHELLTRLGESARAAFVKFGNRIASDASITPFPKGGVHHLTRYVMNYINLLAEYGDTLNLLLEQEEENMESLVNADVQGISSYNFCPMACRLRFLTSILEANLDKKSNLYGDVALKHIFMMNNIHYMVQKVNGSEVGTYFGEEWIRKHIRKFQQHATCYERATWSSVLSGLMDDGTRGKAILKERCKGFCISFEDVYKCQTGWSVPDRRLQEDLRISASLKVVHAYRAFIGRIATSIGDKHIKYTEEDVGNYILHLYEGSQRSLHHPRRR